MQSFYADRISPRMGETPEGFLVCLQARLCRSGDQEYRGSELGLRTDDIVTCYRPESEVLDPTFLASIEGKCLTDSHPTQFVDCSNASYLCRGHCQNVRQGDNLKSGEVTVIADLIVTDRDLAMRIKNGALRELSMGYEYALAATDDPDVFEQRKLRCNHLALVTRARAGPEIRVLDSAIQVVGRAHSCPRELSQIAVDDVAEINFAASARRFLGKNILEVRNR